MFTFLSSTASTARKVNSFYFAANWRSNDTQFLSVFLADIESRSGKIRFYENVRPTIL